MAFTYDFDAPEKYIVKPPSEHSLANIKKLEEIIGSNPLNEYDRRFINDIKQKILKDRKLTDRQQSFLSVIVWACKNGNYNPALRRQKPLQSLQ